MVILTKSSQQCNLVIVSVVILRLVNVILRLFRFDLFLVLLLALVQLLFLLLGSRSLGF